MIKDKRLEILHRLNIVLEESGLLGEELNKELTKIGDELEQLTIEDRKSRGIKVYGREDSTIRKWEFHGVVTEKYPELTKEFIAQKYAEGLKNHQIAELVGASASIVSRRSVKFGVVNPYNKKEKSNAAVHL